MHSPSPTNIGCDSEIAFPDPHCCTWPWNYIFFLPQPQPLECAPGAPPINTNQACTAGLSSIRIACVQNIRKGKDIEILQRVLDVFQGPILSVLEATGFVSLWYRTNREGRKRSLVAIVCGHELEPDAWVQLLEAAEKGWLKLTKPPLFFWVGQFCACTVPRFVLFYCHTLRYLGAVPGIVLQCYFLSCLGFGGGQHFEWQSGSPTCKTWSVCLIVSPASILYS